MANEIKMGKIVNIVDLRQYLHFLGKVRYSSEDKEYLENACKIMINEPKENYKVIDVAMIMWALFNLDYKDETLLKYFTDILLKHHHEGLNEIDIANCLQAYGHFDYLDYDILEILLRKAIKTAPSMRMKSLAVIFNALS